MSKQLEPLADLDAIARIGGLSKKFLANLADHDGRAVFRDKAISGRMLGDVTNADPRADFFDVFSVVNILCLAKVGRLLGPAGRVRVWQLLSEASGECRFDCDTGAIAFLRGFLNVPPENPEEATIDEQPDPRCLAVDLGFHRSRDARGEISILNSILDLFTMETLAFALKHVALRDASGKFYPTPGGKTFVVNPAARGAQTPEG